jgi:hypothetical protein
MARRRTLPTLPALGPGYRKYFDRLTRVERGRTRL